MVRNESPPPPRFLGPLLGCLAALLGALAGSPAQTKAPLPAITEGKYVLEIGETRAGEETFALTASGWTAKGWFQIMGRKSDYRLELSRPAGVWTLHVVVDRPGQHQDLEAQLRDGRLVAHRCEGGKPTGKPFTVKYDPAKPAFFFVNLVWAHLVDYGRELAWRAHEKSLEPGFEFQAVGLGRKFPIKVLEVEQTTQPHGAKKLSLWRFVVQLANVELAMFCSEDGLPLRLQVQAQRLQVKLEGYEDLSPPAPPPATPLDTGPWRKKLSPPRHQVEVLKKVMIPMRDGVKLAADVYRPRKKGKYPVILARTPYHRQQYGLLWGVQAARRGYVLVSQDCRGRFASEGEWYPLRHDGRDGYDTLEWIIKQPWSDGNVGMIGASYAGWVQWLLAKTGHPALKCIVPQVSPPDPHENLPYEGGAFFLASAWWTWFVENQEGTPTPAGKEGRKNAPAATRGGGGVDWQGVLRTLPLTDLDKALGLRHPVLDDWLAHPLSSDPYWRDMQYQHDFAKMKVPALHISGWFDSDQPGAVMNFPAMRRHAATPRARTLQRLVMGPWTHAFNSSRRLGTLDFGQQAVIDMKSVILRWFDHHLKGIANGIEAEDPVWVFVAGENRWHHEKDWPLPQTKWTRLHLAGGPANRLDGGGRLTVEPRPDPPDTYTYDPADPSTLPAEFSGAPAADPLDLSGLPDREDVLDYTSAPLAAPVELTGPFAAHLTVATDGPDTDFAALLLRVTPGGKAYLVASGLQRLRYRLGTDREKLVEPGEVVEVTIDMWANGLRLDPGDRLRVHVLSSLFPMFARNLNTGEPEATGTRMRKARQTVYHDEKRLSYVRLPVIPRAGAPGLAFETRRKK